VAEIVDSGEDFDFEDDDAEETAARHAAFEAVKLRCDAADIKYHYEQYEDEDPDLVVHMPAGRDKVSITLFTLERAQRFLEVPFEKINYLENYEGIVCYEENYIEAVVAAAGTRISSPAYKLYEKLSSAQSEGGGPLILKPAGNGLEISLGPVSAELSAIGRLVGSRRLSIRLSGALPQGSRRVAEILEKLSNALFFQLDLQSGVALNLVRQRKFKRFRFSSKKNVSLEYPKFEYDDAPMTLYWYGRGSQALPLLQFLAFYQVVEYFFPIYSQAEAQRRIRSILKDPSFRADRESDIGRVISCIKASRGAGYFDERTQLRATVNEVINADQARELVTQEGLREFYKEDYKKVVDRKLPIASKDADLRNDIADRIYDIRCKIVHTKADGPDGEFELLLPNSPEEQFLGADIEVLANIARACLVSSGSPLQNS
jgi:hypothetical protein